MSRLHNKHIILAITGGIAAYKSAELVRLLITQPRDAQKPRAASVLRRSSNCNDDEQPRRRSVVVPSAAAVGETETQMITSNVQGNVSVLMKHAVL